ncbi:DNA-directed RNA polymerase III, subunit Rpc31 [Glomus cerebriforme]|uniref:DNA-directed RNA polymerase III subunit n=1 Tax=Glomus cerebriforme TaxID=658196 RepID=A0A397SW93_9GLOM|nr:DNA-directed RNA polymerase III, subunit Rpc31 [Glomus cerebriforme]
MSKGRRGGRRGFGGRNGSGFGRQHFSSELQTVLHQTLSNDIPAEIEFKEAIPPSEDEHTTINALFGYKAALRDSAFFITTPPSTSADIQIYSDQFKIKKAHHSLRDIKTDLAFFPQELHMVKDDSIMVTASADENQKKVQFDLNSTFGQLLEQESKEKTKNVEHRNESEFGKYTDMEQVQDDEEDEDAADYVESYFDNGETDDIFDDDGGGEEEAYFD